MAGCGLSANFNPYILPIPTQSDTEANGHECCETPVELSPELAPLNLAGGEPAPSDSFEAIMADSNFAATPYPTYNLGGDDDSVQQAVLTAHAGGSIERNQDSQFAALSRQNLQGRISDGRRESVETKFEAVVAQKDAEIRAVERWADLKVELATIRAEGVARDNAALARELANEKSARQGDLLAAIAKKIGL